MDIPAVYRGLKTAAATITGLRCFEFVPDAPNPPSFFPAEMEIDYDKSFAGGMEAWVVTCRVLVPRSDDRSGQIELQNYLKRTGSTSIKAALEATRTPAAGALGGACHDVHVRKAGGIGLYEHPMGSFHFGADIEVYIIGRGD
ncbi:hypothetical protein [Lentzea albidocapillata]|uniref:hypothetical protein n=1 Tax=Lentzea albidocapillata TaxID=40571 RepID=UPI00210C688C|nr:hypothetical protein [Lentzea albidocapillata]